MMQKDRVVVRSNGQKTYFASDIAYHKNKFARNFDQVINIWGADHHGYVPRVKAMVKALGYEPERLRVLLVQIVSLLREGKLVSMSTRLGEVPSLCAKCSMKKEATQRVNILLTDAGRMRLWSLTWNSQKNRLMKTRSITSSTRMPAFAAFSE